MAEFADAIVKGGFGAIGVIASAYTLTKFVLSTPVKIGERPDEEKGVDLVMCIDTKKYGEQAVEYFVKTVKEHSLLQIAPRTQSVHHKDAKKDDVCYLVGATPRSLVRMKNRKEKILHAEMIDEHDDRSFTSGERLDLIMFELHRLTVLPSTATDTDTSFPAPFHENDDLFAQALHSKLVKDYFPLHDDVERHALVETWVKKWKDPQPLDNVRDYFGDDIGFYFAFLGMYTKWLIVPTVLAVIAFAVELVSQTYGAYSRALYSLFITSWATAFLKFWKRRESSLQSHWGISASDAATLDHERPDFTGERRYDEVEDRHFTYFSSIKRMQRYLVTAIATVIVLAGILKLIFLYFELEKWCQQSITPEKGWEGHLQHVALLPSIGYSIVVLVFDMKYSEFAAYLTQFENHRTDAEFSNALVLKLASFYFVNNFGSLFFLAFQVRDMMQLQETLSSLLITRQIIGNIKEQLVPYFTQTSSLKTEAGKIAKEEHVKEAVLTKVEAELLYPTYEGTFDDYLELFVQFGQVTLFASAYPLASLWSLANNIMEIRSDGFKLCMSFRRSRRFPSQGIGTWQYAFSALGYISVMTNCAIFGLHSGMLDQLVPSLSFAGVVVAIGLMEHVMLGVKVCIEILVPDTPTSVLEARRMRRAALRKKAILQVELSSRKLLLEDEDAMPSSTRSSVTEEEATRICGMGPERVLEWMKQEKERRHKVEEQVKSLNDVYMGWVHEEQNRRKEVEKQLEHLRASGGAQAARKNA